MNLQNIWSMSMEPKPAEKFAMMDEPDATHFALMPIMSGEKFGSVVNYPVIVEGWEKKDYGRHKRRWLSTFTEVERNKIGRYYGRFYKWHLVTGTPHHVALRLNTITLLQRAAEFFAGV